VDVVADHPVTQGIGSSFTVEDELYLYEVFEDDVIPLLRSQHEFIDENFYSASLAIQGKMFSSEGWQHTPGSNLIGWVKSYRNSPIVYLQCGDASNTYENPAFTQLIKNAVTWVAGDEAKVWARAR
ncbi:MAG: ThuA domain-containing protein, partial [Pseudomonadota bacterium]